MAAILQNGAGDTPVCEDAGALPYGGQRAGESVKGACSVQLHEPLHPADVGSLAAATHMRRQPKPQSRSPRSSEAPRMYKASTYVLGSQYVGDCVLPQARFVHPRGFRLLKDRSPFEREMKTYFRLPRPPSARTLEEAVRIRTQLRQLGADVPLFPEACSALHGTTHAGSYPCCTRGERCTSPTRAEPSNALSTCEGPLLLDGFILLAAGALAEDDADLTGSAVLACVTEVTLRDSQLTGVVREDMGYFTRLRYLDLSGNRITDVSQLVPLVGLEELRLVCNGVTHLSGLDVGNAPGDRSSRRLPGCRSPAGKPTRGAEDEPPPPLEASASGPVSAAGDEVFPHLRVLNLAYNHVCASEIVHLSRLPLLEKLDLSGNNLVRLPADLSFLANVTHFALERNKFTDSYPSSHKTTGCETTDWHQHLLLSPAAPESSPSSPGNVFTSLSTMPSLQEVNLNYNSISSLPQLNVRDGRGVCFPMLRVLALANNRMSAATGILEALVPLSPTLRVLVLSGNEIERTPVELEKVLSVMMDEYRVEVIVSATVSGYYYVSTDDADQGCQEDGTPITASQPPPGPGFAGASATARTTCTQGSRSQSKRVAPPNSFDVVTAELLPEKKHGTHYTETAENLIVKLPIKPESWFARRRRRLQDIGLRRSGTVDPHHYVSPLEWPETLSSPKLSPRTSVSVTQPCGDTSKAWNDSGRGACSGSLPVPGADDNVPVLVDHSEFFLTEVRRGSSPHNASAAGASSCTLVGAGSAVTAAGSCASGPGESRRGLSLPSAGYQDLERAASHAPADRADQLPQLRLGPNGMVKQWYLSSLQSSSAEDTAQLRECERRAEQRYKGLTAHAALRDLKAMLRRPLPALPAKR